LYSTFPTGGTFWSPEVVTWLRNFQLLAGGILIGFDF